MVVEVEVTVNVRMKEAAHQGEEKNKPQPLFAERGRKAVGSS